MIVRGVILQSIARLEGSNGTSLDVGDNSTSARVVTGRGVMEVEV